MIMPSYNTKDETYVIKVTNLLEIKDRHESVNGTAQPDTSNAVKSHTMSRKNRFLMGPIFVSFFLNRRSAEHSGHFHVRKLIVDLRHFFLR